MYLKIITWDGKSGHKDLLDTAKPQIMLSDVKTVEYMDDGDKKKLEVIYKDGTYEYYILHNNAYLMNDEGKTINVYSPINANCYVDNKEALVV